PARVRVRSAPSVPAWSAAWWWAPCWACSSSRCSSSSSRSCPEAGAPRPPPSRPPPEPSNMTRPARLALALALALSASGCATLVPATPAAQAGIPATWPMPEMTPVAAGANAADTGSAPTVADIGWRDFFADPRLEEVVALALDNNRDLRVAILNVERARAMYRIRRADRLPSIGAEATLERVGGDLPVSEQYTAG